MEQTIRQRIHDDVMYLAARLVHRGAQTEEEKQAAEYIRDRFREHTPDVEVDEFSAIESAQALFASYFGEFFVVGIIAHWWPLPALMYGIFVFAMFLAEFSGYQIMARFLPQYDSQNVIARFHGLAPKVQLVLMAHYDSGGASPLTAPGRVRWLRPALLLCVLSMVVVLGSCAAQFFGGAGYDFTLIEYIRWTAIGVLVLSAVTLYFVSGLTEDVRGANVNASGVAALLQLADRFSAQPLLDADVCLVAAGSNESWMSGVRHFLDTQPLDKRHTFLLNIEGVGAPGLCFLTREGMLHSLRAGRAWREAAAADASSSGISPARMHAVPTGAHIPLMRGYQAMTITALGENGAPPHWNWFTDQVMVVDESAIARAAGFVESLARRVAATA